MVIRRYQQRSIYEELTRQLLPDHEALQWEQWLLKVDQVLEDCELLDLVQEALAQRWPGQQESRAAGHACGSGAAFVVAQAPEELELCGVGTGSRRGLWCDNRLSPDAAYP